MSMGNLFHRWVNTPTRGELRTAKMADMEWLEHKAKCYRSAYAAGYADGYAAANRKVELSQEEQ